MSGEVGCSVLSCLLLILVPRGRAPFVPRGRDLWPGPTPEVRDSRTSRHSTHAQSQSDKSDWFWSQSFFFKAIQNRNVVGVGQRSRFLVLTKRSAASGDENGLLLIKSLGDKLIRSNAHACKWLR